MEERELLIQSSLDGSRQPSLFYQSASKEKRPLLVGLHTWSFDRFNQISNFLPVAERYDFHLLLPEFRGSNLKTNPNCTCACGSEYAKQDIKDAIDHVAATGTVDTDNIFMLGLSGGGHMAMLMAGFCPEQFKAVGAFVPITDLTAWVRENEGYREHVLACCGEDPEEMLRRSPIYWLDQIAHANIKIFHGKYDPVVPVSHSLNFYNRMMEKHPDSRVFLDVFDGGHEIDMTTALHWILSQYREEKKLAVSG